MDRIDKFSQRSKKIKKNDIIIRTISDSFKSTIQIMKTHDDQYYVKKKFYHHKAYQNEIKAYSLLKNENMIKIFSHKKSFDNYEIFMEYAPFGDLVDLIKKVGHLNEDCSRWFFKQIVNGLSLIHSQGYAHLDLKLENILIGNDNILKFIDFESLTSMKKQLRGLIGTKGYIAPEIIRGEEFNACKADIFSLGVCLFILCTGLYPFSQSLKIDSNYDPLQGMSWNKLWNKWETTDHRINMSPALKKLLESLLNNDPNLRPSLNEILVSSWMCSTQRR